MILTALLEIPVLALLLTSCFAQKQQTTYYLIDNCSRPFPGGDGVVCSVDEAGAIVGLGAARLRYDFETARNKKVISINFIQGEKKIATTGTMKLWLKSDGSGHSLRIRYSHAAKGRHGDGREYFHQHKHFTLKTIPLDFTGLKEFNLPVANVPRGRVAYLSGITIYRSNNKEAPARGEILLDDFRLYPEKGKASATALLALHGPTVRPFAPAIELMMDVRQFGEEPIRVDGNITMNDKNGNLVTKREFKATAAPGEAKELKVQLRPENFSLFQPPFKLNGELTSPDAPQISSSLEITLVMGNSRILFDDFGNLHGNWFCSGLLYPQGFNEHQTFAEDQRVHAGPRTNVRIARTLLKNEKEGPPGRYAMVVEYNGPARVYSGIKHFLQGAPYKLGVWIHGDGNGADVYAVIIDYNAPGADYYAWREKAIYKEPKICRVDFTGWQYFEVSLPGIGIGKRSARGTSMELDYPLTLSAFTIKPTNKEKPSGKIQFGPIFVETQQSNVDALSTVIAYDDPNHEYSSKHSAWVTVQNGWRITDRSVNAVWALLDRSEEIIARGREAFALKPEEQRTFRIDLSGQASKITNRLGPLRLQVVASDTKSAATSEAQIVLSKPDSTTLIADFESDRGYLGLNALGVIGAPPPGEPAARTTTAQKRSGTRSLEVKWDKAKAVSCVSIDPPLPGIPIDISFWVYGDGSGVIFYPLIGDQFGVINGGMHRMGSWDLYLPRSVSGSESYAVKVDWKGWREVKFRLPVIPKEWKEKAAVLPFAPSYPLGVHLTVAPPKDIKAATGTLYIDDIRVRTHLEPEGRLDLRLDRFGESNLVPPGGAISVTVSNFGTKNNRTVQVTGGLHDWRGRVVIGIDQQHKLPPGSRKKIVIAQKTAQGAYLLQAEMREGGKVIASIQEDLIVAAANSILGGDWQAILRDKTRLRRPLKDRFALVQHDWDWAEFAPGNLQVETLLKCAHQVRAGEQDPWMLLGYSTYWAASEGFKKMKRGEFPDRNRLGPGGRDWGHATDIFHIPERLDDWENFVLEMMRKAGRHVTGWILWNTPDSNNSLGVPPKKFAQMIKLTDKWRRRYCPEIPLVIGGMGRDTAIPYLEEIRKEGAIDGITGVNLRIDAGITSPEDGKLVDYIEDLRAVLNQSDADQSKIKNQKSEILLTDLDWACERSGSGGLDAFDQAAYLARATFLLDRLGVRPTMVLANEDETRLGFGMIYKKTLEVPPMRQKLPAYQFKPVWYGMTRVKKMLDEIKVGGEVAIQDIVPGRTRCMLYERKSDRKPVAIVWRNNEPGEVSFEATGMSVATAEDIFGSAPTNRKGWFDVGKMPTVFVLNPAKESAARSLTRLRVRDAGNEPSWPFRVIASFKPETGTPYKYTTTAGRAVSTFQGRNIEGRPISTSGILFDENTSEKFEIPVPKGSSLILRKQFYLDETGHEAEVIVDGRPAERWNLKRGVQDGRVLDELSSGIRESIFLIPTAAVTKPAATTTIEIKYVAKANTLGWTIFTYMLGDIPLSAFGPIHSDSTVAPPRYARNVVGLPMQVGKKTYTNGIGVFAPSFLEYSLNGQFSRFTAEVGIDTVTQGKGSVVFEVYADGKKVFTSSIMSGLDEAKKISLDIKSVQRLRLIVTDGGDGNKFDAANWGDAKLGL